MPCIVGISAFYHDSACCLLRDGRLVAAAQEERFSRIKHDPSLPLQAFEWCLQEAGLRADEIDGVAYYERPGAKLERQLAMDLPAFPPFHPDRLLQLDPRAVKDSIANRLGYTGPVECIGHHLSHAASSFYFSGFEEAALFNADAVGEWATTTYGKGNADGCTLFEQVNFPHSLGLLYSAITSYLGFRVNNSEYKVMGLAPYGEPRFMGVFEQLLQDGQDGQFQLDPAFFNFSGRGKMYTPALVDLFGIPAREQESEITGNHKNIARSLQLALEEMLVKKVRYLHKKTALPHLCMAGGVALNCVANSRISREAGFERVFIQPAAGDAGGCLGAAAVAHHRLTGECPRLNMSGTKLGPSIVKEDAVRLLNLSSENYTSYVEDEAGLLNAVSDKLTEGKIIGWCQAKMEFGPRALGARSILADPSVPGMQEKVNKLIKRREAFRPFAPAVLAEHAEDYFEMDKASPYMLFTFQVKPGVSLPAITHVDGSARVQTVSKQDDPRFYGLLQALKAKGRAPVLLNTSFNMRKEPIVCTAEDAVICFIRTGLDVLVLGDVIIERDQVPVSWLKWWEGTHPAPQFEIDHDVYAML